MRLNDKVALVTGGASGMGEATVARFLAEGAYVLIADFNEETGAAVAAATAAEYPGRCVFQQTDVASEAAVEAAVAAARSAFGRLDIMFNNAGVGGAIGPLTQTTEADWDYTFAVLAKGVFFGIKHAARCFQEQGEGGSIINTASIAALSGDGGPLVYSAAKAAVVSLTRSSAVELAPDRIRVNAICPGYITTPLAAGGDMERTRNSFSTAQPWPESGEGEHIAGSAVFLASDDARFVTGEALVVDGGLTAAGPRLSETFPRTAGRNSRYSGITKGSTGADPELRKL